MDLRSGQAFWPIQNGLLRVYPPLARDERCEVAVIGGGITGALVAYHLVQAGLETVVLDRRDVGMGSTAASTAVLQYEIDTHLTDLVGLVGEEHAVRAYRLCLEAVDKLAALVGTLDDPCSLQRRPSLYLASSPRHVAALREEAEARRRIGIAVGFLGRGELAERYGIRAPGALRSQTAAEADAYRLTHRLLEAAQGRGLRVYDRTEVTGWSYPGSGVRLATDRGYGVSARAMVFASGYETQAYLRQRLAVLRNTYAFVSEPLEPGALWPERCLVWETARPYLYVRTTPDHRVIVGGADDPYRTLPLRERRIPRKERRLLRRFGELFPGVALEPAFAWAGTFGETKDGLAYIGESPEIPRAYFALGYGGNGITYSLVAAEILRDLLLGHDNPDRHVFRFDR
ncbi:NAD(P)/FAD-dependent oxidoreductase [Calidithermus chliarophilus]|uniref:NAD(P)/FAD-dependent oxidoreductase n=2 Tax=Calidithermus chliarophilus TaxID=52023 RepID=UPI0004156E6B|nr:FAD-dependent oxidoreductase [Calidithermus chliarophilus]